MYRYDIKGEDFKTGEVKKIGKAIAVIVDKEWLGARAIVIKKGIIKKYADDELDEKEKAISSLLDMCIKTVSASADPFWEGVLYALDHIDEGGLKERALSSLQNVRKNK